MTPTVPTIDTTFTVGHVPAALVSETLARSEIQT